MNSENLVPDSGGLSDNCWGSIALELIDLEGGGVSVAPDITTEDFLSEYSEVIAHVAKLIHSRDEALLKTLGIAFNE